MSHEVTPEAYKTRLGNLTAKSVLALLADVANDEGYGWPSVEKIAGKTEIEPRTVRRVLQVFTEIGLIARVDRGAGKSFGIQLDMGKLGTDLTADYAAAHAIAQRKKAGWPVSETLAAVSETYAPVSETAAAVSETLAAVSETAPPHPLKGVTAIEPPENRQPPAGGAARGDATAGHGLDAEQAAHLEGLLAKGRKSDAEMWAAFYREENARAAHLQPDGRAEQARIAALRAAMPTVRAARAWVMREAGIVASIADRELEGAIEGVLKQDREAGVEWWTTGVAMAAAWKEFRANGTRMRHPLGPAKFYRLGIWRDSRGWPWDQCVLRREKREVEARVGS